MTYVASLHFYKRAVERIVAAARKRQHSAASSRSAHFPFVLTPHYPSVSELSMLPQGRPGRCLSNCIIKKFYIDRDCPSFKIQSHMTENSFDIFRFEFGNILLTLKIPPKSDILNISRERLFYSISINNRPFDVEQCMTNFEQLRSTLRGII